MLQALAANCAGLLHVKVGGRETLTEPALTMPAPSEQTWHQHIPDTPLIDEMRCNELMHMAARFPTQADIAREVDELSACLVLLGRGCRRLQHLDIGEIQQYTQLESWQQHAQPAAPCLIMREGDDENAVFPALQHIDISKCDCIKHHSLMSIIKNAPMVRIYIYIEVYIYVRDRYTAAR